MYNVFALLKRGGFFLMLPVQKQSYVIFVLLLAKIGYPEPSAQISVSLMETAGIQCLGS